MFDMRLKENFKLKVFGPSRCGKPLFIADLLQHISTQPPSSVNNIYYKVWQSKFDEMKSLVHLFFEDQADVVHRIKEYANGAPTFVFDDKI